MKNTRVAKDNHTSKNTQTVILNNNGKNENLLAVKNISKNYTMNDLHIDNRDKHAIKNNNQDLYGQSPTDRQTLNEILQENGDQKKYQIKKKFTISNSTGKLNMPVAKRRRSSAKLIETKDQHDDLSNYNTQIPYHQSKTTRDHYFPENKREVRFLTNDSVENTTYLDKTKGENSYMLIKDNKKVTTSDVTLKPVIKLSLKQKIARTLIINNQNKNISKHLNKQFNIHKINLDISPKNKDTLQTSIFSKNEKPFQMKTGQSNFTSKGHGLDQKEFSNTERSQKQGINKSQCSGLLSSSLTKKTNKIETGDIISKMTSKSKLKRKLELIDQLGQQKEQERRQKLMQVIIRYKGVFRKLVVKIREKLAIKKAHEIENKKLETAILIKNGVLAKSGYFTKNGNIVSE